MLKQTDSGGQDGRETGGTSNNPPGTTSFGERIGALKNILPFVAMIWQTGPGLTAALLVLRSARALLPIATLYVGKLIVDRVHARQNFGAELGVRKARNLRDTGAQAIAAANPGCAAQLDRHFRDLGDPLPIYHPVELVWRSIIAGASNGASHA